MDLSDLAAALVDGAYFGREHEPRLPGRPGLGQPGDFRAKSGRIGQTQQARVVRDQGVFEFGHPAGVGEVAGGDDGNAFYCSPGRQMAGGEAFAGGPGMAGVDVQVGEEGLHGRKRTGIGRLRQGAGATAASKCGGGEVSARACPGPGSLGDRMGEDAVQGFRASPDRLLIEVIRDCKPLLLDCRHPYRTLSDPFPVAYDFDPDVVFGVGNAALRRAFPQEGVVDRDRPAHPALAVFFEIALQIFVDPCVVRRIVSEMHEPNGHQDEDGRNVVQAGRTKECEKDKTYFFHGQPWGRYAPWRAVVRIARDVRSVADAPRTAPLDRMSDQKSQIEIGNPMFTLAAREGHCRKRGDRARAGLGIAVFGSRPAAGASGPGDGPVRGTKKTGDACASPVWQSKRLRGLLIWRSRRKQRRAS
ncbi:hypothetical protein DVDV_3368 [Desulfovibrio sp. DV]|nr:hypothetical protein DVDV_3368 [Desulfovibrio sp. DV]